MVMDQGLQEEIDRKREVIKGDRDYTLRLYDYLKNELRALGDVHTYWLEHPDQRKALLDINGSEKKAIDKARKGIRNMQDAWYYVQTNKGEQPFTSFLSHQTIQKVAKIIDPTQNSNGYRTKEVSLGNPAYRPPKPQAVHGKIDDFLREIKQSDLHPVERAAKVHLAITGIQPFADGNKRTSRLLQNAVLYEEELPPAVIPTGEREIYLRVLFEALINPEKVVSQRFFYDYIGGKVNAALDEIIGDLYV